MTDENRTAGWARAVLLAAVALSLMLVAAAAGFYVVFVKVPSDLAYRTASGFQEFFNFTPRVSINESVVIEQNTPILEVSTVSRDLQVEILWVDEWLGSTKTVELRATFTAKAGFDLRKPFAIDIRRYPLSVRATLPDPELLSLEMKSYRVLRDEDGWWNRVSVADREEAMARLQAAAREKAGASGILRDAETTAEARIRQILKESGQEVQF